MKHTKRFLKLRLASLLLLTVVLAGCSAGQPGSAASIPTDSSVPTDSVTFPVELGDGLALTGLSAASGAFPEAGSDTLMSDVLCATFVNNGAATLQYAKVNVSLNGANYAFEISTIPDGGTVHAFDLGMQEAPESIDSVTAAVEYVVFFQEEPSLDTDRLQVTFSEGSISIKNISDQDINQEISVYYKTVVDDVYMGGITYRARVGTLPAGQEVVGHSSHAGSDSELMFVTYGN